MSQNQKPEAMYKAGLRTSLGFQRAYLENEKVQFANNPAARARIDLEIEDLDKRAAGLRIKSKRSTR